jgi:hypothetical protein
MGAMQEHSSGSHPLRALVKLVGASLAAWLGYLSLVQAALSLASGDTAEQATRFLGVTLMISATTVAHLFFVITLTLVCVAFYQLCTPTINALLFDFLGDPDKHKTMRQRCTFGLFFLAAICGYMATNAGKAGIVWWSAGVAFAVFAASLLIAFNRNVGAETHETDKRTAVELATKEEAKKTQKAVEDRDGYKTQLDALQTKYDTDTKALQSTVTSLSNGKAAIARELGKVEQDAAQTRAALEANRQELDREKARAEQSVLDMRNARIETSMHEGVVVRLDSMNSAGPFKKELVEMWKKRLQGLFDQKIMGDADLAKWMDNFAQTIERARASIESVIGPQVLRRPEDSSKVGPTIKPIDGRWNDQHNVALNRLQVLIGRIDEEIAHPTKRPPPPSDE